EPADRATGCARTGQLLTDDGGAPSRRNQHWFRRVTATKRLNPYGGAALRPNPHPLFPHAPGLHGRVRVCGGLLAISSNEDSRRRQVGTIDPTIHRLTPCPPDSPRATRQS